MAGIQCPTNVDNLIADFDLFINGGITSDVTLSDSTVIPSYQKFAKSELYRVGRAWSISEVYMAGDMVSYNLDVYIANNASIGSQPDISADWELIKRTGPVEGYGIKGYVSFHIQSLEVVASQNFGLVTELNATDIKLTFDSAIGAGVGNRMNFAWSYSSEGMNFDYAIACGLDPALFCSHYLAGTCIRNDNFVLEFHFNRDDFLAVWGQDTYQFDHRVDVIVY